MPTCPETILVATSALLLVGACTGDDRRGPAMADAADGEEGDGAPSPAADAAAPGAACGAGGTCVSSGAGEQSCPDGTRYDLFDPGAGCELVGERTTCCEPWGEPCTYVAGTWTLSLDPFTCDEPDRGRPWMCLFTGEQVGCEIDAASLFHPKDPALDAAITVVAGAAGALTIDGALAGSERTFRCTGRVATSWGVAEPWQCEACDGERCAGCVIETTPDCDL